MNLTYAEIIAIFKDVVISAAAITGAVVAIKGLGTWQRQLKGQSEYELSRRILIALFKYRDAINGVRNPAMWNYEMPLPSEEEAEKMSQKQVRFYGTSKAYQNRWDKVQVEKTSLYADLLESEAIWGVELKELFNAIFDLENELFIKIRHNIELINPDMKENKRDAISKIDDKSRDIMYAIESDDHPDEYKKDLLFAIEMVEKYLKPKLNHEKI